MRPGPGHLTLPDGEPEQTHHKAVHFEEVARLKSRATLRFHSGSKAERRGNDPIQNMSWRNGGDQGNQGSGV
jgi:hypothetical protein